jgi:mannan endo-1,4-beta-mannosidase
MDVRTGGMEALGEALRLPLGQPGMQWIGCRPGLPYFVDDAGESWTPIGANEAITWPELAPLFRRKDVPAVERHLHWLKENGVTCLRLMLEYCHGEHRYFERPVGRFVPNMVQLWDDLFELVERVGLRVLLTPVDTFFMWTRWGKHPYNRRNGGPCSSRRKWITCPDTRAAIKNRLAFACDRWGGSPALFAWDLWNELHPAHGDDDASNMAPFIEDLSSFVRAREVQRYGRAHLQTVSIFGPKLVEQPETVEPIFRHPSLDFASTHLYEKGTIDDPRDTVAPALATAKLMRFAVQEAIAMRPVLDSEHGPIHRFLDHRRTLPEAFDDEYFRHIQWAHLASGGAGGGMRWPNRHPHVLTPGMRRAQAALSRFLPLIDWTVFRRRNLSDEVSVSESGIAAVACGDERQAVVWLLFTGPLSHDGRLAPGEPREVHLTVPGLADGAYEVVPYDTVAGQVLEPLAADSRGECLTVSVRLAADLALAVRPLA